MPLLLQAIGGSCYLLNKVFFSLSERAQSYQQTSIARRWRIASWTIYIAGLLPWVILFVSRHDWIAASVEGAGAPAMVLGLVRAIRGKDSPRWLMWIDDYPWLFVQQIASLGFIVDAYLVARRRKASKNT